MNLSTLTTTLAQLHLSSCLIRQRGELFFEYYKDPSMADAIAKINSCTKSVLSALVCIAMDRGLLPDAQTPILEFYPQIALDTQTSKQAITLHHLLTMTSGMDWTEFGGQNSFPRMTRTSNWVNYVLDQPLSDVPGARFEYNSGNSQLLSALLVQATGMPTAQFAEAHLFGPLGIDDYTWECDPQGVHTGGFGLWLRPTDMLKFGQLYLQQGKWGDTQLISQERVTRSTQPAIPAAAPRRGWYGWHWWTDSYCEEENATNSFAYFNAYGYGGQCIYVIPSLETVVVLTNQRLKKENIPLLVFRNHIAPLLLEQQKTPHF
jgi:CubicO group peptidase (beta-lactamase class C family)